MSVPSISPRALLGLAVITAVVLLWVLAFTGVITHLFSTPTRVVEAQFTSIGQISPGDPVRIDGVQVGTVGGSHLDPGGHSATLELDIDTSQPIYANASASILWRTILGANEAVAIDPGNPAAGPLGRAPIPASRDSVQVTLDEITQAIHGGAQSGLRQILEQTPVALSRHPALGTALGTLSRVAPSVKVGIGALRGEITDTDLENLVTNTAKATAALRVGTNADATRAFLSAAAQTLAATAADPAALRASIDESAALMPELAQVSVRLNHSLSLLDPVMSRLTPEMPRLRAAVAELIPTVVDARTLLGEARPVLTHLVPAVRSLAGSATVGIPVIDGLAPSLARLNQTILPSLGERFPEQGGRPVYEEIGSIFSTLGAVAGYFDNAGEQVGLTSSLGGAQDIDALPCQLDFSGTDLLVCNSLKAALGEFLTGGTSLLQGILGLPGMTPGLRSVYTPLLAAARGDQSLLAGVEHTLSTLRPTLARWLFSAHSGTGQAR